MKQILVHAEIRADDAAVTLRVVHQAPKATARLPYTASNGVRLAVVGSGRPFLGLVGGVLTLGLRGGQCPDAYRHLPVTARLANAKGCARMTRDAVAEFRGVLNKGPARA